jgi:hypothetical protein
MFAPPVAKPKSAEPRRATVAAPRPSQSAVNQAQLLQRTIGNQATLRLLAQRASVPGEHENEDSAARVIGREAAPSWDFSKIPVFSPGHAGRLQMPSPFPAPRLPIQAKLEVGAVNDPLEHEADRVADRVMRMPEPQAVPAPEAFGRTEGMQRACSCGGECDECKKEQDGQPAKVQLKSAGSASEGLKEAPPIVHDVLRSPGHPLNPANRAFFEPRFARDFSKVRVHTDSIAATAAEAIFARAFTSGRHIVFGTGHASFDNFEGKRLLAHELSHVVQQSGHATSVQRAPDDQWKQDVNAARYRARIMADRIRKHGKLSPEARAKINSELQYFEGPAKDAYSEIVQPALRAVVEIEMPAMEMAEKPAAPPPAEKKPEKPPVCTRLPEAGHGKKCKFFVYDSTLSGWLGRLWHVAADADAALRPSTYVIPSGKNMEEMLDNLLSTYAEKDCDCTDEVQFWSHGSKGNGAWISSSSGGQSEIEAGDFNIPGLEKYGDDTTLPGYQEWRAGLSTYKRRLVLLRRTICDSDSTVYYRSCQAFQGEKGLEFAKASSKFWRCDVSGHTKSIGLTQPGKHTLSPCEEPDWPATEGAEEEGKKGKEKLREVKPR